MQQINEEISIILETSRELCRKLEENDLVDILDEMAKNPPKVLKAYLDIFTEFIEGRLTVANFRCKITEMRQFPI